MINGLRAFSAKRCPVFLHAGKLLHLKKRAGDTLNKINGHKAFLTKRFPFFPP